MSKHIWEKELLELAAKAINLDWIKDCVWIEDGFYSPLAKHERIAWNPRLNNADALQLAAELMLDIWFKSTSLEVVAETWAEIYDSSVTPYAYEDLDSYQTTATAMRRAIVKVAAQIGETL